ncbi:MAG: hypothetical protein KDF59_15895 [Nitrosomonas sp.]|nr:hypothetical protein [Nitrosomonas sp.]
MSEEQFTYKYFSNGYVPVRVSIDDKGRMRGAEVPDRETTGFKFEHSWLTKIGGDLTDEDVLEIGKEEFDKMVADFMAQKKSEPEPPPEISGMG